MIKKKVIKNMKKREFRHRAIFPGGYPPSIVAAITFHCHVRNGMKWFYYAINTEIESFKI
jgi:hypothetical protein